MMYPCWFISWRMISGRRMFQWLVVQWLIVFCHLFVSWVVGTLSKWPFHGFQMGVILTTYQLGWSSRKASLRWKTQASLLNYELGFAFIGWFFIRFDHGIHHHFFLTVPFGHRRWTIFSNHQTSKSKFRKVNFSIWVFPKIGVSQNGWWK